MIINIKLDKNIEHNIVELIKCYSSELNIFYNPPKTLRIPFQALLSTIKLNHLKNNEFINSKLSDLQTSFYRIMDVECKIKIKL